MIGPTIYIAGPMTGLPEYNLPAFAAEADALQALGYAAVNPGRHGAGDDTAGRVRGWSDYMRLGLADLLGCDGVALLPGWEASRGAQLEVHVARALGMPVEPLDHWLGSTVGGNVSGAVS